MPRFRPVYAPITPWSGDAPPPWSGGASTTRGCTMSTHLLTFAPASMWGEGKTEVQKLLPNLHTGRFRGVVIQTSAPSRPMSSPFLQRAGEEQKEVKHLDRPEAPEADQKLVAGRGVCHLLYRLVLYQPQIRDVIACPTVCPPSGPATFFYYRHTSVANQCAGDFLTSVGI